jgi:hypothetical protein
LDKKAINMHVTSDLYSNTLLSMIASLSKVYEIQGHSKHDRVIANHVVDYFSTAENPYNRWEKQ